MSNPTPKVRYIADVQNVKAHRQMVDGDTFTHAIDVALLQYQAELHPRAVDFNNAAANSFRLAGALEFVHVLRTLADSIQVAPKTVDRDNLKPA